MKICPSCKIKVGGDLEHCPLCQNELQGEAGQPVYPSDKTLKKHSFIYKLQMFLCLAAMVISLALDFMMHLHGALHWSLIVAIWVIGGEILARLIIRKHANPTQIITLSAVWLTIMITPTLLMLGLKDIYLWYVLPGIQTVVLILNFIFAMIDKAQNAMVYILSGCFVGIISSGILIHILRDKDIIWVICLTISVIFVLALAIFHGKRAKSEISKRLNF